MAPDAAPVTATLLRTEQHTSWCVSALVAVTAFACVPPLLVGPTPGAIRASAVGAAIALALVLALVAVRSNRRLAALQAIAEGDEWLPLPGLERVRRQLLEAAWQATLAAGLQVRAIEAGAPPRPFVGTRRVSVSRVPAGAACDLGGLATLLRTARPRSARAVAMCELLLVDASRSPLHGRDAEALRDEVARIADVLAAEL